MKPPEEIKKNNQYNNAPLENLTTKKMSTGPNLYYDGYGSYDYPKKNRKKKLLAEVKKKFLNYISREFGNEENEHWTLCTMTGSVVMILRRIPFNKIP